MLLWGLITKSKQVVGHEGIEEGRIGLPLFPCLRNWAPNSNFQLFQLRFSRNLHLQSLLRLLSFSPSLPSFTPSFPPLSDNRSHLISFSLHLDIINLSTITLQPRGLPITFPFFPVSVNLDPVLFS